MQPVAAPLFLSLARPQCVRPSLQPAMQPATFSLVRRSAVHLSHAPPRSLARSLSSIAQPPGSSQPPPRRPALFVLTLVGACVSPALPSAGISCMRALSAGTAVACSAAVGSAPRPACRSVAGSSSILLAMSLVPTRSLAHDLTHARRPQYAATRTHARTQRRPISCERYV